jgi:hypothetical protein
MSSLSNINYIQDADEPLPETLAFVLRPTNNAAIDAFEFRIVRNSKHVVLFSKRYIAQNPVTTTLFVFTELIPASFRPDAAPDVGNNKVLGLIKVLSNNVEKIGTCTISDAGTVTINAGVLSTDTFTVQSAVYPFSVSWVVR